MTEPKQAITHDQEYLAAILAELRAIRKALEMGSPQVNRVEVVGPREVVLREADKGKRKGR